MVILLWMPLVVTSQTVWPFIVGKALYARVLIEVIAALWVVLVLWNPAYRLPRSWVLLAFAMYVVMALLSAVGGVSFARSLWSDYQSMVGEWDLGHWLLFALVAVSVLRSPRAWRSLLNWNLGVALVLSLLALGQVYQVPGLPSLLSQCRVDATLGNPTYLAAILVVTIPVAVGFLVRSFLPGSGKEEARSPDVHLSRSARGRSRREQTQLDPERLERRAMLVWRAFLDSHGYFGAVGPVPDGYARGPRGAGGRCYRRAGWPCRPTEGLAP